MKKNALLAKSEVKIAGYWPQWPFPPPPSPPPTLLKKKLGQYTAILTEQAWSIDLCHAAAVLSQETDWLTEEMNGWMNEWTNKQRNTWMIYSDRLTDRINKWMNDRTNEQTSSSTFSPVHAAGMYENVNHILTDWPNKWINERTTERKSKWINERWISPSAFSPEHAGG